MNKDGPSPDVPHSALPGDQRERIYREGYIESESRIEASSARENLELWVPILGSAIVWGVQLQTNYSLVPWACANHNHWILYLTSAVFLLLAATPGWLAFKHVTAEGGGERQSAGAGRRRFMAVLGALLTGMFVLLIFAQAIPIFFVDPCLQ